MATKLALVRVTSLVPDRAYELSLVGLYILQYRPCGENIEIHLDGGSRRGLVGNPLVNSDRVTTNHKATTLDARCLPHLALCLSLVPLNGAALGSKIILWGAEAKDSLR